METLPADFEMWKVIAAVVLPLLLSIIVKQGWSKAVKAVIALIACIAVATGDAFFAGTLSLVNAGKDILVVFFIVVTTYKGFWLPTGIAPKIEKTVNK